MKILKLGVLIFVISTLLVFGTVSTALGDWWQNDWRHNNSGKMANDLEKFVDGNILVSSWYSSIFHNFGYTYDSGQNMTTVRWSTGNWAPCQWGWACYKCNKQYVTYRYLPRWSWDGVPGPIAGPILSGNLQFTTGVANLSLSNTAIDGGPVTIGIIQVGPSNTVYPLEGLTWNNLNTIPWATTWNNIHLMRGGILTLPTVPMLTGAVGVVYRAQIWLDSDPTNIVQSVVQITPSQTPLP
jgi:hypothetical protein